MKSIMITSVSLALLLILNGCSDSKDANKKNFKTAIQTYLDAKPGLCVGYQASELPFTMDQDGGFFRERVVRANALVEAGLLSRRDTEVQMIGAAKMVPGYEYNITEAGKKYLVAGAAGNLAASDGFCSGHYIVKEVTSFSEPTDAFGGHVSQANYTVIVEDVADWAKHPAVQAAFPSVAKELKADVSDKAVLVLTSEGWMHERIFRQKG